MINCRVACFSPKRYPNRVKSWSDYIGQRCGSLEWCDYHSKYGPADASPAQFDTFLHQGNAEPSCPHFSFPHFALSITEKYMLYLYLPLAYLYL